MFTNANVLYSIHLRLIPVSIQRFGNLNYPGVKESISHLFMLHDVLDSVNFIDPFCRISAPPGPVMDIRLIVYDCHLTLQVNTQDQFDIDLLVQNMPKIHRSFISTYTLNASDSHTNDTIASFQVEIVPKYSAISNYTSNDNFTVYKLSNESNTVLLSGSQWLGGEPLLIELGSSFLCPMVNMSISEIPAVDVTANTLTLTDGFVIGPDMWYADVEFLYICVDEYGMYLNHVKAIKRVHDSVIGVEVVVSIVCVSLSMLALIITLFSYVIHANLRRTLPGKNLMSLCGSLLLAQSFYLIANFTGLQSGSTFCQFLGILVHFFWLLTFFSMSVCTFHMFYVLTRTRLSSESSGLKRYLLYLLYSIVCSLLFIAVNIIASNEMYGHVGYGKHACYVSSQTLLYFTFCLPLAIVIISNLGMLVAVIVKIKQTSSVSKNVQNERNDIIIFAKLSTITGGTWIFGFIYLWTDIKLFSYVFIVLNASQGLFLCFAFVANRRMLTMYRELSTSLKHSNGSSSLSRKSASSSC